MTPFSKIYNQVAAQFPLGRDLLRFEDVLHSMLAARNRVVRQRIPKSLTELGEAMNDMDYRQNFAFDNGTPPQLFFHGIHTGLIVIEIDGTFSVVPNRNNAATKTFDDLQQLLMVHYSVVEIIHWPISQLVI